MGYHVCALLKCGCCQWYVLNRDTKGQVNQSILCHFWVNWVQKVVGIHGSLADY